MASPVLETLRVKLGDCFSERSRWCVALSGGLDSAALLHAMCTIAREDDSIEVRAVHVDHGLHPDARQWAAHCESLCLKLGVPLQVETVTVDSGGGDGPEAAARRARYAVFERSVGPGEYLLTAHHQDDQLETVLLRLMRGAGTDGLGGIGERSRFGAGWLIRPLLNLSRQDLEVHARSAGIDWVEDPTNRDTALDRNYLRHEIVPRLRKRWPGVGKTVGRTARLSVEAADLLDMLAEADSRDLVRGESLDLTGLRHLEPERQRNVMRLMLKRRGLAMPSEVQLRTGLEQLLSARSDRQPALRWGDARVHRYRDRIYVLDFDPAAVGVSLPAQYAWDGSGAIDMGPVRGRLRLVSEPSGGVASSIAANGVVVRFRHGGERIRESGQEHHKQLKKLFQERGVVPWMRSHVPLVYAHGVHAARAGGGDRLLAIGDLWVAADAVAAPGESGYRILWENHPPTQ